MLQFNHPMPLTFTTKTSLILSLLSAILLIATGIIFSKQAELKRDNALAIQKIQELSTSLQVAETKLFEAESENATLTAMLNLTSEDLQDLNKEVKKLDRENEELEKITKTDKQLLEKYSKVYFLNEHYVPAKLKTIPSKHLITPTKPLQIHAEVLPELEDMIEEAEEDGVNLKVVSAYRSFGTQETLKSGYTQTYGAGTANAFSADQGYSEHQLGTTVDFSTPSMGASLSTTFATTEAYKWLTDHAYQYGFILSYPKGNAYYQFEPWHWRFVGTDLARKLHRTDTHFYDLEQREINEYLVEMFD
jgi:D-alanyl-D-alanine carboxypeptidase